MDYAQQLRYYSVIVDDEAMASNLWDAAAELATLHAENERLRERVKAAEYVLKQARPESGYWDTYAKEALK